MSRNKKSKSALYIIAPLALGFVLILVTILNASNAHFLMFDSQGAIAKGEKHVIITAVLLMLIVVVPVLTAVIIVANKYRADREDGADVPYDPNWTGNKKLQFLWWAFPGVIVIALAVLTWHAAHTLDPFKPIASDKKPITIQVVALEWKWLFIYPDQHIATVNYVEFPQNTPVNFELTADAPMSSFWIPQLGGQIYAMAGMSTQLHLIADQAGEYQGSAAEINGAGFAGMKFMSKSVSDLDFIAWVDQIHKTSGTNVLNLDEYNRLSQPSTDNLQSFYASVQPDLYDTIIKKFTGPNAVHVH